MSKPEVSYRKSKNVSIRNMSARKQRAIQKSILKVVRDSALLKWTKGRIGIPSTRSLNKLRWGKLWMPLTATNYALVLSVWCWQKQDQPSMVHSRIFRGDLNISFFSIGRRCSSQPERWDLSLYWGGNPCGLCLMKEIILIGPLTRETNMTCYGVDDWGCVCGDFSSDFFVSKFCDLVGSEVSNAIPKKRVSNPNPIRTKSCVPLKLGRAGQLWILQKLSPAW